ncbi:hypothetical protein GCM10011498_05630 [Amylibacter cionae]|uniref:Uncharacterized protein n=1 Tax=Neptunicoccus cionae TaxID=2035344 RepID=A0A916QSX1_9RHOB|nr:hypothetical protein GCM10011498_05630 [Amylibacter cionae]
MRVVAMWPLSVKRGLFITTGAVHLTDLEVGGLRPEVENVYRFKTPCFPAPIREMTHIIRQMHTTF